MNEGLFVFESRLKDAHRKVLAIAEHVDLLPSVFDDDGDTAARAADLIATAEESLKEALELVEQEATVRRQISELGQ